MGNEDKPDTAFAETLDSLEAELEEMMGAAAAPTLKVGDVVGERYKLTAIIGEGGMGRVYKAEHLTTGGEVAVKTIRAGMLASPRAVKRFELEARHTATLSHPNIVKVFDFGRQGEVLYQVMEFIEGRSLRAILREEERLSWGRMAVILEQVLKALGAAHASERQLIHRDIKPDNILVTHVAGQEDFTKVVDFGISRALEGTSTGTGSIIGSPHTMAPEQWKGEPVTPATDLYAVGCTAYITLAGRMPFTGSGAQMGVAHIQKEPPDLMPLVLEGTPEALCDWVAWLMRKDPAQRPQDAQQALVALQRIQREGTAELPQRSLPNKPASPSRLGSLSWTHGVLMLAFALLAVGAGLAIHAKDGAQQEGARPARQGSSSKAKTLPEAKPAAARILSQSPLPVPLTQGYERRIDPSGRRVLFLQTKRPVVMSLEDHRLTHVSIPAKTRALHASWFPDGERILVGLLDEQSEERALWEITLAGKSRKILDGVSFGEVSPDGRQLVYGMERGLFRSAIDGSGAKLIEPRSAMCLGIVGWVAWLSDSSGVVYTRAVGESTLCDLQFAGREHRVTLATGLPINGGWNPMEYVAMPNRGLIFARGARLMYLRLEEDNSPTDERELANAHGYLHARMSANRSGDRISYCRYSSQSRVEVASFQGGQLVDIRSLDDGGSPKEGPQDWAGERLLFTSDRSGSRQFHERDLRTDTVSQLGQLDPHPRKRAISAQYATRAGRVLYWELERLAQSKTSSLQLMALDRGEKTPVKLEREPYRIESSGGPGPEFRCVTTASSEGCVMHTVTAQAHSFRALDPGGGALKTIATVPVEPDVKMLENRQWALRSRSPEIALVDTNPARHVRFIDRKSGRVTTVPLTEKDHAIHDIAWAPAGDGLIATGPSRGGFILYHIAADGQVRELSPRPGFVNKMRSSSSSARLAWALHVHRCDPWQMKLETGRP